MSQVGIILTSNNQLDELIRCMKSLYYHTHYPYELIIVDNNVGPASHFLKNLNETQRILFYNDLLDKDEIIDMPFVLVQENHNNLVLALNAGIEKCLENEDILFVSWIHTDMLFFDQWLDRLIEVLISDESIGKVACDNAFWKQHFIDLDDYPEKYQKANIFAQEIMKNAKLYECEGNECPWLIPRIVFNNELRFDDRFKGIGGYEDLALNLIIEKKLNLKCVVTRRSLVWHKGLGYRGTIDTLEDQLYNARIFDEFYRNKFKEDVEKYEVFKG